MPEQLNIGQQISRAVEGGDTAGFAALVRDHPEHVWDRRRPGRTHWMMSAASCGRVEMLAILVASGADVNAPVAVTSTYAPEGPVDTAAREGQLEATRWLLDHGAVLHHEVQGRRRCLALSRAAEAGHLQVVRLLVDRGADVNSCWKDMTALDHAEMCNQPEVAEYLRSAGGKRAAELSQHDPGPRNDGE